MDRVLSPEYGTANSASPLSDLRRSRESRYGGCRRKVPLFRRKPASRFKMLSSEMRLRPRPPCSDEIIIQRASDGRAGNRNQASRPLFHYLGAGRGDPQLSDFVVGV